MGGLNRREVMGSGLAFAALTSTVRGGAAELQQSAAPAAPTDQAYWRKVAAHYDLTPEIVQLENGMWGMMARPVLKAYVRHQEMVNRRNSFYVRREYGAALDAVRDRLARNLGCLSAELAFTRGSTESLLTLIAGYNRLRPGDTVLYADLDYDSMQAGMRWLKSHRGVDVATFSIPQPASHQNVLDAYDAALKAYPRARLLLLTQVSHRIGLVMPVADIVGMARARDVDVILDASHGWGQLDFKLADLGADFVGLTCQKWIGAPVGTGAIYVRRERMGDIDPALGVDSGAAQDIHALVHTGTSNFAAYLTVADALDFHESIGAAAKEARLRYLRDRWAESLRDHGRIEILTPSDPRLTCGITSFRRRGETSLAENKALAAQLLERYGIFTVHRDGTADGACVRVTPGVFTSESDVDKLIAALKAVAEQGSYR